MRFCFKHSGIHHNIFIGTPEKSPICALIQKTGDYFWEWQIRLRNGGFDVANSKYKPILIRYGCSTHRERALRASIDYIKSEEWK